MRARSCPTANRRTPLPRWEARRRPEVHTNDLVSRKCWQRLHPISSIDRLHAQSCMRGKLGMLGAEHLCRADHKHSLLILNGKACWVLGHVYELRPASTHETSYVNSLECILSSRASAFPLPRHASLQDEPRALHHFMTAL